MSYTSNNDLPQSIRDVLLDDITQTIYREAYNAGEKKYALGSRSMAVWLAWAAIKRTCIQKSNGTWTLKTEVD